MTGWLFVELGGSSAQTAQRDGAGRFWFSPGVVRQLGRPVALACPGIVRDGRVLYATNLGWPDEADPARELGLDRVSLVVNDAIAAALGESVLRTGENPGVDLIYVSLGTGVGSARVTGGIASDLDLGHRSVGGQKYCEGCRTTGCLNSELSAKSLPEPLSVDDQDFVARLLASALAAVVPEERALVVLGGGIARRYPLIAQRVDRLARNPVDVTIAPAEAKSAAYAGLDLLCRLRTTT